MMQPQSKLKTTNKETREGNLMSIPSVQSQKVIGSRHLRRHPKSVNTICIGETVLYWNEHNFRMILIEYVPCLMGIIWGGRPDGTDRVFEFLFRWKPSTTFSKVLMRQPQSYQHKLSPPFQNQIGSGSYRRMSEPEVNGSRHLDPHGIAQDSFLFGRFLKM